MIKRRALRAAVLATLEEQRIDALAYPTLRRKPALIGEAQGGTNCQLSATTGLPAIAMPAGFTTDGLPIALELLGGAWTEATLLKYALRVGAGDQAASRAVQHAAAREGRARPAPTAARRSRIGAGDGEVELRPHDRRAALRRTTLPSCAATDRVVALTIQRSDGDKPGPIVAHLLAPNQISGSGHADDARPRSRGSRRRQAVRAVLHAAVAARRCERTAIHAAVNRRPTVARGT